MLLGSQPLDNDAHERRLDKGSRGCHIQILYLPTGGSLAGACQA